MANSHGLHVPNDLISIIDAVEKKVDRLRDPIWAMPEAHLKINITDRGLAPWAQLYSPFNQECNGRDPFDLLIMFLDVDSKKWLPYDGPLPEAPEYIARVAAFEGCLK